MTPPISGNLSVNSQTYWDKRFQTDWEQFDGPTQSRYFSEIAIEVLPSWLLERARRDKLSVIDWGCAQGDGTDVWASFIDSDQLCGVDFSSVAIEQAQRRYPTIKFVAQDWMVDASTDINTYDIVYSSNTIEHFSKPFSVMKRLSERARKALVFVLPFRETDRHHEHFFTFRPENIPTVISAFKLVCARVVDCSLSRREMWAGEQIVLVYAESSWVESLGLQLSDLRIEHLDADSTIKHRESELLNAVTEVSVVNQLLAKRVDELAMLTEQINLNQQEISKLNELVRTRDLSIEASQQRIFALVEENDSLQRVLSQRNDEIVNLNSSLVERDSRLSRLTAELDIRNRHILKWQEQCDEQVAHAAKLEANLKGRMADIEVLAHSQSELRAAIDDLTDEGERLRAELIKLSDWAAYINRSPIVYAMKRSTITTCRFLYRVLPLPAVAKLRLRSAFLRVVHPFRKSARARASGAIGLPLDNSTRSLSEARGGHNDVLMFAVIDWDFRVQRPQHFARQLAHSGRRVFYFSNHFIDSSEPGYQIELVAGETRIHIVRLHVPGAPQIYFDVPSKLVREAVVAGLAKLLSQFKVVSSLSIMQHPFWYPVVERLPNSIRVYDCMDDHAGFGHVCEGLNQLEIQMLKGADLVIATSTLLAKKASESNLQVALIRNAVEYEYFSLKPEITFKDPSGRRILGYYGAIADWFDIDLVREIAHAFPDCLVLLVGSDTVGASKQLKGIDNIEFIGEVPYSDLLFYLYAFDVCLVPFKRTSLTQATNPVKVYEYLAAGKPVVSVCLPELEFFSDCVLCSNSPEEFVRHIGRALSETQSINQTEQSRRQCFAAQQTWQHRLTELESALTALAWPKISVVILTHNNFELTKNCLDSLFRFTDYQNLEVIVVDNASTDPTINFLKDIEHRIKNVSVIFSDVNLGFAAGNNLGLAKATGDYLVLMNNDTVVTWGWALTMLRHFQRDPSLGLIGPVTNNIGNEAKVDIQYHDLSDMPFMSFERSLHNMGVSFPLVTAAFFFVMFDRRVYEQCGPLCEDFGLGYFEDDDYCRRVEAIGKKIMCAEDVFVHHHLSASFGRLSQKDRMELFEKNRAIYEKKWGRWKPHQYRS